MRVQIICGFIDLSLDVSLLDVDVKAILTEATIKLLGGAPAEAPKLYDLVLTQVGDRFIDVIKETRAATNLGLKEAKDLCDSVRAGAQRAVLINRTLPEYTAIVGAFQAQGATVDLLPSTVPSRVAPSPYL